MKKSWYKASDGHVAYNVFKKQQSVINEVFAKWRGLDTRLEMDMLPIMFSKNNKVWLMRCLPHCRP
jgi:energy-converting hydrogenase Eha subunit F